MHARRPGVSLLEVLVVLGILVFLISMTTRLARQDLTAQDLRKIEHAISGMLMTARQEALLRHNVVRLHLKFERNMAPTITLESLTEKHDEKGQRIFAPFASIGGINAFTFPATWKIKAIYQGSEDLLSVPSKGAKSVFCHLTHGGIIPSMLIHLEATQHKEVATLRTEPFQKTITLYHSLLAPPKKGGKAP